MPQAVIHSRDARGCNVVSVPLNNRAHPELRATVDLASYQEIVTRFGPVAWFVNRSGRGNPYVRLFNPERRNNEMVARVIIGDIGQRRVRYRDGDPLNLCKSNLEVITPPRGLSGKAPRWHLNRI